MKIVTWNCNGALRNKFEKLLNFDADLYIIQECENPVETKNTKYTAWSRNHLWIGDTKNKGIGIFSAHDNNIELCSCYNPNFRYILPICITINEQIIYFFAIWAMNNKENREARYIGQIWHAINYYSDLLDNITILIGDFNSNKIWDYKGRVGNHTDVVNRLKEIGIESMYHKFTGEEQGRESLPTFYLHRNHGKPYHIDYIFAAKELSNRLSKVEIGQFDQWIQLSDHVPLICDFE